jgi:hypothetical protein
MVIAYEPGVTLHGVVIMSTDVTCPFGGGVIEGKVKVNDIPFGTFDAVSATPLLKPLSD